MIMDDKPPLDENLLIHFGIKGMRWGHRKTPLTPAQAHQQAIHDVKVKQQKLNANRVFNAYLEAADANSSKSGKRRIAKIEQQRGKKISNAEAFDLGASRAKRKLIVKGIAETLFGGAVMGYGIAKLPAAPEVKAGAALSAVMLTGGIGAASISRIGNFREANKAKAYAAELKKLEAQTPERRST